MDKYTTAEEAYKNGYERGYADATELLNRQCVPTSSRGDKYEVLMTEAKHHGTDTDIIKLIANELSWRVILRIVHKLMRKRGAEL